MIIQQHFTFVWVLSVMKDFEFQKQQVFRRGEEGGHKINIILLSGVNEQNDD